jgi:hypothetical protein
MQAENPPAFPSLCLGDPGHPASILGMTLRDWFAGQSLAAQLETWPGEPMTPKYAARLAFDIADAMLAERNKETNHG